MIIEKVKEKSVDVFSFLFVILALTLIFGLILSQFIQGATMAIGSIFKLI